MELYYNPDALSEKRIKHTFVGRQWVLEELTTLLKQQPEGAGVQHVLIVAPRGMGKTTIFLMLGFAVEESDLEDRWQVVRFREESYNITDAAEFWMEALRQLRDPELAPRMAAIAAEYRKSADLEAAAVALMKDWVRTHGKRLLLLVENFDGILEQIHSEQENSRLRNVLMNDGSVMLIGAATSFFEEARGYEKPLYNFFKVYNLEALNEAQVNDLLLKRAESDGIQGFAEKLKKNAGQIRALAHFTGGNPRLVLMLYAVIANAELTEVRVGLEKLLDEVTPYFKARTELLPPQQRKILDQIARESARTMEGQSPTAIAKAIRMTANQVSSQLKRMMEGGYVRSVNVRGRVAYYTLSEPLFALWYQMRFGRDARERMNWLVSFLRVWYDDAELESETERLCLRLTQMLSESKNTAAKETLEYGRFLVEAIRDESVQLNALCDLIWGHIEAGEPEQARALLKPKLSADLRPQDRGGLLFLRYVTEVAIDENESGLDDLQEALRLWPALQDIVGVRQGEARLLLEVGRLEEAAKIAEYALGLADSDERCVATLRIRADALVGLGQWKDAAVAFAAIIHLQPNDFEANVCAGWIALSAEGPQTAGALFEKALGNLPETDNRKWQALFGLFVVSCLKGEEVVATAHWATLAAHPLPENALQPITDVLSSQVLAGHGSFLLRLIAKSSLNEPLAPFLRALEYIESKDRDLIEKLSPEVRTVVEGLVTRIQANKKRPELSPRPLNN